MNKKDYIFILFAIIVCSVIGIFIYINVHNQISQMNLFNQTVINNNTITNDNITINNNRKIVVVFFTNGSETTITYKESYYSELLILDVYYNKTNKSIVIYCEYIKIAEFINVEGWKYVST